jgi:hypothetical protein
MESGRIRAGWIRGPVGRWKERPFASARLWGEAVFRGPLPREKLGGFRGGRSANCWPVYAIAYGRLRRLGAVLAHRDLMRSEPP